MADLEALAEALIKGDRDKVVDLTKEAISEGMGPKEILEGGLIAGMSVVGRRFKANEVNVPEVLIAARAMHGGMDILQPELFKAGVEPIGTVVLGTVKGDLHDIGKNLVNMMLTGGGLKVVDIGIDAPAEKMIMYRFDTARSRIAIANSIDLAEMRAAGAASGSQPSQKRRRGRP